MTEIKLNDVIVYLIERKRGYQKILVEEKEKGKSWNTDFRNAKSGADICQELIDDLFIKFGQDRKEGST